MKTFLTVAVLMTAQNTLAYQSEMDLMQPHLDSLAQSEATAFRGGSAPVSVGSDNACNFRLGSTRIQDAIDSGASEIRIASNTTYTENLVLDNRTVTIRGGFSNCTQANANNQDISLKASIDGNDAGSVVTVFDFLERSTETRGPLRNRVVLENLILENGQTAFRGGGLTVFNTDAEIIMRRVEVNNNVAANGAGIALGDDGITLTGIDLKIQNNAATATGGGINCNADASILMYGPESSILSNRTVSTTSGQGGGVYLDNGCQFIMRDGANASNPFSGIILNQADGNGGGLYIQGGAQAFMYGYEACFTAPVPECFGSNQSSANLTGNQSGTDGGAVYVTGTDSSFFMDTGEIRNNTSDRNGGAIAAFDNAEVLLTWDDRPGGVSITPSTSQGVDDCWNPGACLVVENNRADSLGGGVYVAGGAIADVVRATIKDNRANLGVAGYAIGAGSELSLDGSLLIDNGDAGAGGFTDGSLFRGFNAGAISLTNATVADNAITSEVFSSNNGVVMVFSTIFSEIMNTTVYTEEGGSPSSLFNCVVSHEIASIPAASSTNVILDEADFVNPQADDYRLQTRSQAIDLCAVNSSSSERDLQLIQRGLDAPEAADLAGPVDAGAYEYNSDDIIFINGFD